eukprot:3013589-Pleurochrysis_carterae.AAC.1
MLILLCAACLRACAPPASAHVYCVSVPLSPHAQTHPHRMPSAMRTISFAAFGMCADGVRCIASSPPHARA